MMEGLGTRIEEAAKAHLGRTSTVRRFQTAAGFDTYGFALIALDGTFLVADWRVKDDGEIGFTEEAVASESAAEEDFRRRVEYGVFLEEGEYAEMEEIEGEGPVEIDIEEAFTAMLECAGPRWRIALRDAEGRQIASIAGGLLPPESFEQEGLRVARFGVSREGMEATVRFRVEPGSICAIYPSGTVSVTLSNGASWVATPLK